jgi:hypothetical protein
LLDVAFDDEVEGLCEVPQVIELSLIFRVLGESIVSDLVVDKL